MATGTSAGCLNSGSGTSEIRAPWLLGVRCMIYYHILHIYIYIYYNISIYHIYMSYIYIDMYSIYIYICIIYIYIYTKKKEGRICPWHCCRLRWFMNHFFLFGGDGEVIVLLICVPNTYIYIFIQIHEGHKTHHWK